jgi:hypothetical protein
LRVKLIQLDNMPVKPTPTENEEEFISRCMSEENESFPDESQRYAVCKSKWDTENMTSVEDMKKLIKKQIN